MGYMQISMGCTESTHGLWTVGSTGSTDMGICYYLFSREIGCK